MNKIINRFFISFPSVRKLSFELIKPTFFLLLVYFFFPANTHAQITIDAQYRNRFEFRDGYKKIALEGSTPAAFISQRTRLSIGYENEQVKLKFTPQDVRVWGDEDFSSSTGVYGNYASLDLFEAYVQLKTGNTGWISVGRQQLVYDNQRLLAARNWNQNGIAYDAVVFKWTPANWDLHLGGSWNSTGENVSDNYYDPGRIKSLNFLWAKHNFPEKCNISLSHIASGVSQNDSENKLYFRQTSGIYAKFHQGSFTLSGNVYHQFGENNSGNKVSAWLADFDAALKAGRQTYGFGLSYLSGNKKINGQNKTDHLFDVLYGARHRFFGAMDYFSSFSSHTLKGGLADYYFYFDIQLSEKTSLKNTAHYFRLAQTNEITPDSKNLGFENNLILKHKFSGWSTLEFGYLFALPTNSLKTIQNRTDNKFSQFIYLQLAVTPVLFKSKTN